MNTLQNLYAFLEANRKWNRAFQFREYRRHLSDCADAKARITALLHMVAHTQSAPKLGSLAEFWKHLEKANWKSAPSLTELTEFIQQKSRLVTLSKTPWDRLFRALSTVPGWGPKTAALFVKCAIQLHRSKHTELHFLSDPHSARRFAPPDRVYLPVDAVIKRISLEISVVGLGETFDSINDKLHAQYSPDQMLVWDDLWFWGFFTQNSSKSNRSLGWNEARFWGLLSTSKKDVKLVEQKCVEFLTLLEALATRHKLATNS
jgi:hypothetical protein